ncbi:MucR family transcriptional regulator [Sphingomonas sp. BIUV-7]|uniref:MucR family transcriptional regulator n=2 Tax=Sphingomonas natans TaxID=3063330 RepID=A0ABT8YBL7_9SPHN|nr:MucR family transcriptional regulator [Sphingomonas sp. BIUV-7]MDO6415377.1 MucR family transcriptional regulator [Sphingomonas sp. BIUV-7]
MADTEQTDLATLTVQLLSAYVANNQIPSSELADLIKTTRSALSGESAPEVPVEAEYLPAVSVRKSLGSREHILSLIDGRPYKTLKRHLSNHGLTPADYRERYKLAKDYPMVAPAYSEHRRAVAQALGLGQRRAKTPVASPEAAESPAPKPVVDAPATAPKAKAARAGKPRQTKPAAKPAPLTNTVNAEPEGDSPIALAPKRRGRPPAGETKLAENEAATATPKTRGRKPAPTAPGEISSASPPRAKRQSVKADVSAAPSTPAPKSRRKAKAA